MLQRKTYTKEQAVQKLRHYCSYQERCHSEVKEKLYSFGLGKQVVEEVICDLVEQNYLNEERFATQFAGGKFRMNQWGRKKIMHALQQKNVSSWCINKSLKEIVEEDYIACLTNLGKKKWDLLKGEQHLARQAKVYSYLLQKGFEPPLISMIIKPIAQGNKYE